MKEQPEPTLLCTCRCHERVNTFERALQFWANTVPRNSGVETRIVISPDRPTAGVQEVVDWWKDHPSVLGVCPAPVPVLSRDARPRWMPGHNAVVAFADRFDFEADWFMVADDDRWFYPGWEKVLYRMLREPISKVAAYYFGSIALWDRDEVGTPLYNVDAYHWAPLLGRYARGCRFREDRELAVVDETYDLIGAREFGPRSLTAPFYLVEYATASPQDREALFKEQARCGFRDNWTRRLIREPVLLTMAQIREKFPTVIDLVRYQQQRRGFASPLTEKDLYSAEPVEPFSY